MCPVAKCRSKDWETLLQDEGWMEHKGWLASGWIIYTTVFTTQLLWTMWGRFYREQKAFMTNFTEHKKTKIRLWTWVRFLKTEWQKWHLICSFYQMLYNSLCSKNLSWRDTQDWAAVHTELGPSWFEYKTTSHTLPSGRHHRNQYIPIRIHYPLPEILPASNYNLFTHIWGKDLPSFLFPNAPTHLLKNWARPSPLIYNSTVAILYFFLKSTSLCLQVFYSWFIYFYVCFTF
jgi:hypothetical protein